MIQIYTTPSCASCRKAKKWFDQYNIPYSEKNIFEGGLRALDEREVGVAHGVAHLAACRGTDADRVLVDDEVDPLLRERNELVCLLVEDEIYAANLVVDEERGDVVEVVIDLVPEDADSLGAVIVAVDDLEAEQVLDERRGAVVDELVGKRAEVVLELALVCGFRSLHLVRIADDRGLAYVRRHSSLTSRHSRLGFLEQNGIAPDMRAYLQRIESRT